MSDWTYLARFIADEDGREHIGQVDAAAHKDIGLAVLKGEKISAKVITGSIFAGKVTGKVLHIERVCGTSGVGGFSLFY